MNQTSGKPLSEAEQALRDAALEYHRSPLRGKIAVNALKPLANQRDLSLTYSPGVAYPCLEIARDPLTAADYTSRANLVGVITNGTAVLGLGDIGPLAGKPVMEGKGCLFKKFAGIDVFDIELAERDPDRLVEIIAALEPTLGGINLEDIKAPECFTVERKLRERLKIPVFHDDQHGTAIISCAALINSLELTGKAIGDVKVVCSGAGAAAIACLDLMVSLGVKAEKIYVADSRGVIHTGRENLDETKRRYARRTEARTLADVCHDADVLLGCSAAGVVTQDMVRVMARQPIILALANPEPEIRPELARAVRPDCIIATGRSDYPNQVNNVLCFPYIFRGALDAGATRITEEMKVACVREIAQLAKAEISDEVAAAYRGQDLSFGPEYIIPKPFDSRLILRIAPAVAAAAARSGVAERPIEDLDHYRQTLTRYVTHTGTFMRPVFTAARNGSARIVYAEGELESVLRAAQAVVDEKYGRPILVGRPDVIAQRVAKAGLRLRIGEDVQVVDFPGEAVTDERWQDFHDLMGRNGVTPEMSRTVLKRSRTAVASMLLRRGEADAMICGVAGRYDAHLEKIDQIIGREEGAPCLASMNVVMLPEVSLFITDTFVNEDPDADTLARIAKMAATEMKRFGVVPKVAFVSHSCYGSSERPSARKMRRARERFAELAPDIECDGEMHGDAALIPEIRERFLLKPTLEGSANLLVMPNLDAANILFNVLKVTLGHGVTIGPVLLGAAQPVHVLTPSATVRRIINMSALAAADVYKS